MNKTASKTLQNVLDELKGVKRGGKGDNGQWIAHCPAHNDKRASLSVSKGDRRPVILYCHAGCSFPEIADELDSLSAHWKPWEGTQVARYTYTDKAEKPLFDVVRYEMRDEEHPACGEKQFMQQAYLPGHEDAGEKGCPDGYVWGRKKHDVETVLYRQPSIAEARKEGKFVFIAEGEEDVHTLERMGFAATTNPQGAGKWSQSFTNALEGLSVVILPDNDEPGQKHARTVAGHLGTTAESVRIVDLPSLPDKGDVSDWMGADGTREKLETLVEGTEKCPEQMSIATDGPAGGDGQTGEAPIASNGTEEPKNETQSQALLRLAAPADLWKTPRGEKFATFPVKEHTRTAPIRQKQFRQWIRHRFYKERNKPPGSQALQDAVDTLAAQAQFEGDVREAYLRIAGDAEENQRVYVDLGTNDWEPVEVTPRGWERTNSPHASFRRVKSMKALPAPMQEAMSAPQQALELMRDHVRVRDDANFALLLGWLVQALKPSGPYPILVVTGEQGTGKTTIVKMIRKLVDPNHVPTRTAPRSEEDLLVAAENSWILNFDNLSGMPDWLSDALCRLATGGGFGTRKLYTNREEAVFYHQRPIILNGIEDLTERPDLADRALVIELDTIPDEERESERDVWKAFEQDRSYIIGGLLSAVSTALGCVENVKLESLPRMADFAKWVEAAEPAFPVKDGTFREAYATNRETVNQTALESDEVARAIQALVRDAGEWHGKMSKLCEDLEQYVFNPENPPAELGHYNSLRSHMKRIMPVLRDAGIRRKDDEAKRSRSFTLSIEDNPNEEDVPF